MSGHIEDVRLHKKHSFLVTICWFLKYQVNARAYYKYSAYWDDYFSLWYSTKTYVQDLRNYGALD